MKCFMIRDEIHNKITPIPKIQMIVVAADLRVLPLQILGGRTYNTNACQPFHGASGTDRDRPLATTRRRLQTHFKPVRAKPSALDARIHRAASDLWSRSVAP
jgi:hypothetical protein